MAKKSTVNSVIDRMLRGGNKVISLFSGLMAAFLILYSSYVLYDSFYIQNQAFSSAWDLAQYRPVIIDDDLVPLSGGENLKNINEDYRAWLTLYDTPIDYPVLQGEDDLYYANHDIYGKSSMTGSVYLATRSTGDFSDTYSLLYGHHMDNDAMFGSLDHYRDRGYFDEHREGILITEDKVYDLRIFGVLETNAYENAIYNVGPHKGNDWLDILRRTGLIYDDSVLDWATKYLAMSTCSSGATSARLVVFATMTEWDMTPYPPEEELIENQQGNIAPAQPTGQHPTQELVEIPDEPATLGWFFTPRGQSVKPEYWALINLIATIFTLYILLPLLHLKAKYTRKGMMDDANEQHEELRTLDDLTEDEQADVERIERYAVQQRNKNNDSDLTEDEISDAVNDLYYKTDEFTDRFRLGIILEAIIAITAVLLFIFTEDMRKPMVLIDKWTLVHILLLGIIWIIDIRLIRYREEKAENETSA